MTSEIGLHTLLLKACLQEIFFHPHTSGLLLLKTVLEEGPAISTSTQKYQQYLWLQIHLNVESRIADDEHVSLLPPSPCYAGRGLFRGPAASVERPQHNWMCAESPVLVASS